MHLGLAEADQTFLRWVLRGQRSWLIRRHCPSRIPWCKPTRILSPALDSPTRGLLTGLGYKSLVGEAAPEEEVWVEIDRYRDQADSIRVIEGIGKDPEAGSLFGRILQLAAPGVLCPQANAERVQL